MTMQEFVEAHGIIVAYFQQVDRNPNMTDEKWNRTAVHYEVTLQHKGAAASGRGRRFLKTYFSKGPALPHGVKAHEVINALASDASSVAAARDFWDWASDMGYQIDGSVKNLTRRQAENYGMEREWDAFHGAKKTYQIIQRQTTKLRNFLGDEASRVLFSGEVEFD